MRGALLKHGKCALATQTRAPAPLPPTHLAYSRMVRSELKKPLPAVLMMDFSVQASWSLYTSSMWSCR